MHHRRRRERSAAAWVLGGRGRDVPKRVCKASSIGSISAQLRSRDATSANAIMRHQNSRRRLETLPFAVTGPRVPSDGLPRSLKPLNRGQAPVRLGWVRSGQKPVPPLGGTGGTVGLVPSTMPNLTSNVDRAGARPLYHQLAAALRLDIEAGRLSSGVQFPSERKLMSRFGVARSTVRAAIAELRSEGRVVVEKGAGSFVRDPGQERCLIDARVVGMWLLDLEGERPFKLSRPELQVAREPAGEALSRRLELAPDAKVLKQESIGRGTEVARQWSRATLHPDTEHEADIQERDLAQDELQSVLSARGVPIEAIEDEVGARMPTPDEREKLEILDGVPVLYVVRTIRADGRVTAVIETVVAADLVSLGYSLPPI